MANKGKKLDMFDVKQIEELIKALRNAPTDADQFGTKYNPNDTTSKLAFEIGYLGGTCKTTADILEEIIK